MNTFLKMVLLFGFSLHAWSNEVALENVSVAKDVPSVERGADALMGACHSCHSMKYIKYRDLLHYGMDKKKVDEWSGGQSLDLPLLAQMSEADAVQAFGKAPPDLSVMTKARDGGPNYVYSYLIGYYQTKEGMSGNHIYPETKMPDPLGIIGVTDEKQLGEIHDKARDIVSFLAWAADPREEERLRLGYYVLAYLFVLTILMYLVKNQIWARLDRISEGV